MDTEEGERGGPNPEGTGRSRYGPSGEFAFLCVIDVCVFGVSVWSCVCVSEGYEQEERWQEALVKGVSYVYFGSPSSSSLCVCVREREERETRERERERVLREKSGKIDQEVLTFFSAYAFFSSFVLPLLSFSLCVSFFFP